MKLGSWTVGTCWVWAGHVSGQQNGRHTNPRPGREKRPTCLFDRPALLVHNLVGPPKRRWRSKWVKETSPPFSLALNAWLNSPIMRSHKRRGTLKKRHTHMYPDLCSQRGQTATFHQATAREYLCHQRECVLHDLTLFSLTFSQGPSVFVLPQSVAWFSGDD